MKTLSVTNRPDGVALVTFDASGASVNVISEESLRDFQEAMNRISADPKIRGCVLASAKKNNFIAGADLGAVAEIRDASDGVKASQTAQTILNQIAASSKPVVAAVHGSALGGGLEVMLACHARVGTEDPETVFSLPEVQLGLLPGAGGTQRLVRLIGLSKGLPLLLSGSRIRARAALKMGLLDQIAPREELLETAARLALSLADGAKLRRSLSLLDRVLTLPLVRDVLLNQACKQVRKKTRGHYPAPLAILDCVAAGLNGGMAHGLKREAELFGKLTVSPEAKHLIWIFTASKELQKKLKSEPLSKLAVIGSGLMGEGIASVSLPLNEVVLKDISETTLAHARERIEMQLSKRVGSGSLLAADEARQRSRLRTTTEMAELQGSELVIEAVFEDLNLKRKVLAEAEAVLTPKAVYATNTSALPIAQIALTAQHPERVLGMHYFSPVPKMPLLELIITQKTADWALARAQAYGIAQGKTVIAVKDGPGFYTTRILAPFLNEGMLLLQEGIAIEVIDRALKDFGFPMGPLELLDEVGIDVGAHVAEDLGKVFESRWGKASGLLRRLSEAGYKGKKSGQGFYVYGKGPGAKKKKKGGKSVNAKVYDFMDQALRPSLEPQEIAQRVAWVMVNEAVHCLQEQVISSPRDGDIGAIMGLGFPPFRGGPFHYLDSLGAAAAVERLRMLSKKLGSRFEPARLLQEKAQKGNRFYEVHLS